MKQSIQRLFREAGPLIGAITATVVVSPEIESSGRVDQDSLRSGIDAAGSGDGAIAQHGDRMGETEFALYLGRSKGRRAHDDDGEVNLVFIFPDEGFELRHIETRAGTVRVEKMEKERFLTRRLEHLSRGRQLYQGAALYVMVVGGDRGRQAVPYFISPEDKADSAGQKDQPTSYEAGFHTA